MSVKLDMVQTNCGCGKCDFKSPISNGCPTPRREPFMFLDTSSLTQKEKGILVSQLKKDAKAIFDQWYIIVSQFSSWMKTNVSLEDYKEILSTISGIASARKEVAMLRDRKQDIMATKSHLECFAILSDYHSWFNYSILETVINNAKGRTQNDSSVSLQVSVL